MPRQSGRLAQLIFAGILFVAGQLLHGVPKSPDVLVGLSDISGSFLVFLAFAICACSWGRWWTRRLALSNAGLGSLAPALVLGPAWLSLVAFVLGLLGLVGYALSPLHTLILLGGPILELRDDRTAGPGTGERWRWEELFLLASLTLVLGERMMRGGLASGTTDPPMYHLLSPRYWSELGRFDFKPAWPAMFHASWWEHLFLWGNSLLGGPAGLGLIECQLFAQWTHVLLGFGATLAVAFAIQRKLGTSRSWALVGCLAICFSTAQLRYVPLAKNDFGIEAWALFAVALQLSDAAGKRAILVLTGLLAGMAFMGKTVMIISLAPWAAIWAVAVLRKSPAGRRQVGWVLAGGLATCLPIMARNYWFTSNPFYPLAGGLFPSTWMSDYVRGHVVAGSSFKAWPDLWKALREAFEDSTFNTVSLLIFPLAFFRLADRRLAWILGGAACSILAYCSWNFSNAFLRWVAPSLAFLQFGSAIVADIVTRPITRWPRPWSRFASPLALLPAAWLLSQMDNPRYTWKTLTEGASPTLVWRMPEVVNGGDSRAWLRMNAKPEEIIVSLGDPGHYFNYYQHISAVPQNTVFDRGLHLDRTLKGVVHLLRSYNVKYTLDVFHWTGIFYHPLGSMIDRAAFSAFDPVAYSGKDSIVVDLELLEEAIEKACVLPHPTPDDFLLL